MASNAVPGFLPSRYGFRFSNAWGTGPVRYLRVGPWRIPFGDVARGLCGGMIFAACDRFRRGEDAPEGLDPPGLDTALRNEIADRQLASFGLFLIAVPVQFWLASALGGGGALRRKSALEAWLAIKREIDAGRPAMIGLIRRLTPNPLAPLGHQVVGYRYDETPDRVAIGVYDPNHPHRPNDPSADGDRIEIVMTKKPDGSLTFEQSTGERLEGILALPYEPPRA